MSEPTAHKISVVICTYNRDTYLGDAIDSLLVQDFDDFEVVVVDNASKDNTKGVTESRMAKDSRVRYAYESEQGLNFARNCGFRVTTSPIVAYLDDDAIATKTWLQEIWDIYQQDPQVGAAGGKINLLWPEGYSHPAWLSQNLAGHLGAYDLGDEMTFITDPGLTPRGLNYSLRRDVWEALDGFDSKLDRSGKNLLSNGDLYMTQRVIEGGWKVAYLPKAVVDHQVFPDRVKKRWFMRRGWWQGISEYYREELSGDADPNRIRRGTEGMLRGLAKSVKYISDIPMAFDNLVYAYSQLGYLTAVMKGKDKA
ncbi:MAG: glycosyltransferase [Cyanobacteria bacterium P01_H01_bin.130]